MALHWLCVPTLVILLGADDAQNDLAKLQGTWIVVTAEHGGKKLRAEQLEEMSVVIKENTMIIHGDKDSDRKRETATFKLNPATKPKSLDLRSSGKSGSKWGTKTHLGIYELRGEILKLCWSNKEDERPSQFATEPKSDQVLLLLERQGKK